jgi:hypothetical protein
MTSSAKKIVSIIGIILVVAIVVILMSFRSQTNNGNDLPEPPPPEVASAFKEATSTFGVASSTTPAPIPPTKRWDVALIAARHVGFTPPKGYWVYYSEAELMYWLVKGTPPKPGSPDPYADALKKRVALIHVIVWQHDSFPTWERFATTMAQFDCAEGTTSDNLITCLDVHRSATSGKTAGGLPYESFSLNAVKQADQSSKGLRAFNVVRLGNANDYGILIAPTDQSAASAASALAKSMRIVAQ